MGKFQNARSPKFLNSVKLAPENLSNGFIFPLNSVSFGDQTIGIFCKPGIWRPRFCLGSSISAWIFIITTTSLLDFNRELWILPSSSKPLHNIALDVKAIPILNYNSEKIACHNPSYPTGLNSSPLLVKPGIWQQNRKDPNPDPDRQFNWLYK